jgi:hypothetical protein
MRLAKQQHFDAIAEVLVEEKIDICDWLYAGMCTKTEDTPLHYLVKFRPPLSLVDLLIRILSEYIRSPEEARDASGRNPLHVATAAGCHVAVIRRLLQGTKSGLPAMMKDEAGRYALHYACLNSRGHNTLGRRHSQLQSLGSSADAENMVLVTFSILAVAPMASVMIDEEGYTPLHLAMNQRGDDRVIRSLTVTAAQYTNQGIGNKFQRAFGEKHSPVTTEASRTESGSSWDNLYQEHHDEEQRQQPAKSKVDDLMVFCDLHPDDVSTIGWEGASIMTPRSSAVPQHLERPPRVTSLGRGIMTMNQCNSCGQGEIVLESTSNKKSQNGQSLSEGNDEQVLARCWFI